MREINKLVELLFDLKLSANQYLVLYLIAKKDFDTITKLKAVLKVKLIQHEEISDLISREMLKKTKTGYALGIKIDRSFLVYDPEDDATNAIEFFNSYPNFLSSQGRSLPLKNLQLTKFIHLYTQLLQEEEHNVLMDDLQYGKENNLIVVKLENFIANKIFLQIREERKGTENNLTILGNEYE